jgi:hypothetical protein
MLFGHGAGHRKYFAFTQMPAMMVAYSEVLVGGIKKQCLDDLHLRGHHILFY